MVQLYTVEVQSPHPPGGGGLGLMIAGYVLLAYPILVKSN